MATMTVPVQPTIVDATGGDGDISLVEQTDKLGISDGIAHDKEPSSDPAHRERLQVNGTSNEMETTETQNEARGTDFAPVSDHRGDVGDFDTIAKRPK